MVSFIVFNHFSILFALQKILKENIGDFMSMYNEYSTLNLNNIFNLEKFMIHLFVKSVIPEANLNS